MEKTTFFIINGTPSLLNINRCLDRHNVNSPIMNDYNDILYIGQTSKPWDRPFYDGHKKLAEIERANRDKDIVIHFFGFKLLQVAENAKINISVNLSHGYAPVLSQKEEAELCERTLMNFFDPPYNRNSTEKRSSINRLKKLFEKHNIQQMKFAFAFHETHNYWVFGTDKVIRDSEHYFEIKQCDNGGISFSDITHDDYVKSVGSSN